MRPQQQPHHYPVRKAASATITAFGLPLDTNDVVKPLCDAADDACRYDPAVTSADAAKVDLDSFRSKAAEILGGNAAAATSLVERCQGFLKPFAPAVEAPHDNGGHASGAAPAVPNPESANMADAGLLPVVKQHRRDRRAPPVTTAPTSGVGSTYGAQQQQQSSTSPVLPSPILVSPAGPAYQQPYQHRPQQQMQALFAMPPQQQPAQFANPFAQRTAAVGAPPSPSVVIMNIPAEFNTAAALENLCRYHFNRGPRTVVPHFSGSASGAPADFTATLKTFAIEEAHALVNAGPRLVDGFPQITARYATRDEAAAAQAVLTMAVRAKEAEAKEAMDAADVRAGIAPSKDGGSAAAVVTDPLEKSKGDLASYRTELNLLSALGAAADAERKLAVLKAMQALLATIKELEAAKASAPAGAGSVGHEGDLFEQRG
jgi:hypothetical protein